MGAGWREVVRRYAARIEWSVLRVVNPAQGAQLFGFAVVTRTRNTL